MELAEDFLNASWTENNNGGPEFFIINEAIISKLCILGMTQNLVLKVLLSPPQQFNFHLKRALRNSSLA
jgi:hypothetical protein